MFVGTSPPVEIRLESTCGKAELWLFVGFLLFSTLHRNLTSIRCFTDYWMLCTKSEVGRKTLGTLGHDQWSAENADLGSRSEREIGYRDTAAAAAATATATATAPITVCNRD